MNNRIRYVLVAVSTILVFYIVIGGLLGRADTSNEKAYRDLGVYQEVLDRIKIDYVTDPDLRKVTDGAIRGLLEALDPYSTYFTPSEYRDYVQHPQSGAADVGMFVSKRGGFATVVSLLPGSPAEKAGIKPGDLLDRIENVSARDLSVIQIERMLAGPPGSTLAMTVVKEARGEPQKVSILRGTLNYPPVVAKLADEQTAYLRVATFHKGAAADVSAKLKELTGKGADKVVLDLRNCAGGDVQEAVRTASLFLHQGLVAYVSGQRFPRKDLAVEASGDVSKLPLAVLINQSTAGPAELVAAAVVENKRGEAVGTRSFGMGVYQQLIPVEDGSALLLSVAKYYGPDGKSIQDNGVVPSVVQAESADTANLDEDTEPTAPEHFGEKGDQQFQKAIEILKSKSTTIAKAA